jgi:arylsulfatase
VDGHEVDRKAIDHGTPVTFPEDESFDIGSDTRTGVAMLEYHYDPPFKYNGKIDKVTFDLKPGQTVENAPRQVPAPEAVARAKD